MQVGHYNAIKAVPKYIYTNRNLKKSQWFKSEKIEEIQLRKLKKLLKNSYFNVPYYHKIFDEKKIKPGDIKSIDDLLKLPILTKENLIKNYSDLISLSFPKSKLMPYSTGGSTGEPTRFIHDWDSLFQIEAANNRFFSWAGHKIFNKIISLSGLPNDENDLIHNIRGFFGQNNISFFGADEEKMKKIINRIKETKIKGLKGYANNLFLLARYIKENEVKNIKLNYIISSSEMLYKDRRELIKEQFRCEVFDNYGAREFAIGAECEKHKGFHIAAENLIVEFINLKENEHISEGEKGKIIITDLTKYGMPFIRYEIGDIGIPFNSICDCGRELPMIKELTGRTTDNIQTPSGKYISSPALTLIFKDLNVKQYQIVQEKIDHLIIKIVRKKEYSKKDTKHILDNMKNFSNDMKIKIDFVEDIPLTNSGKRLIAISLLSEKRNSYEK